jgi:hypothetical protein
MSRTDDAKAYAGAAVEQGKQALGHAQTAAAHAYAELRTRSESLIAEARNGELPRGLDLDSVRARLVPLVGQAVGQAKVIGGAVSDKADEVRKDPRLAKAVSGAESLAGTVHERVVQPVLHLTGLGDHATVAAKKPNGTKPAQTRPAATPAAAATTTPGEPHLHAVKPTKATKSTKSTVKPTVNPTAKSGEDV